MSGESPQIVIGKPLAVARIVIADDNEQILKLVRELLRREFDIVATARNAQAVMDTLGAHPHLLAVALDVTDDDQVKAGVDAAVARFGRIDILVNNAGFGLLGAVEEATADEVEKRLQTGPQAEPRPLVAGGHDVSCARSGLRRQHSRPSAYYRIVAS